MSEGEGETSKAVRNTAAAAGTLGCLASPLILGGGVVIVIIIGGFGVLLAPVIALILLFGGGGGSDAANQDYGEQAQAAFEGDGKGELAEGTVPDDLLEPIEDAGGVCDAIGPVVIASQIMHESGFNKDLVGPDGEEGISQLPPEKFDEFGDDGDPFEPEDSIEAQGEYLCRLAEDVQGMIDAGEAEGEVLDLTLAAYEVGLEAVRAGHGIEGNTEAQAYVAGVRAQFARYQGIGGTLDPTVGPTPTST
ncbi:lytic transglycosylase domain-containing protein [Streptomyces sp. 7N604]|uniref:lytic transglycosylase domain-containing protein n=1 Tax=Streptomyces sp. 7N604 TaxID=3457415 RepID=UPI003FD178DD